MGRRRRGRGFALSHSRSRFALRLLLGALYLVAGYFHLASPRPFIAITPGWVPFAPEVIAISGLAEIAGAAALLQPWSPLLRRLAGWKLGLYALCVWPANFNHMLIDIARQGGGLGLGYHIPRLLAQPLLIWAAPWAAGAIDWPWRRSGQAEASIARAAERSAG